MNKTSESIAWLKPLSLIHISCSGCASKSHTDSECLRRIDNAPFQTQLEAGPGGRPSRQNTESLVREAKLASVRVTGGLCLPVSTTWRLCGLLKGL